jgi:hypothetical protein
LLQGVESLSLPIHHSCTLILRPVVHALKLSIYLFTSKAGPFLYEPVDSWAAIGIFLRASAIDSVSEFIPLVMARHSPKEEQESPPKRIRPYEQPLLPAAQYLNTRVRSAPRVLQAFDEVNPELLLSALHGAW